MSDAARTLQTAEGAEGICTLLERASKEVRLPSDGRRLEALSARYREYAAALRETVTGDAPPEPDPEQLGLALA